MSDSEQERLGAWKEREGANETQASRPCRRTGRQTATLQSSVLDVHVMQLGAVCIAAYVLDAFVAVYSSAVIDVSGPLPCAAGGCG